MDEKIYAELVRFRRTMMRVSKRQLWRHKLLKLVPSEGGWWIELYASKQYAESVGRNRENRRLVRDRDVVRQAVSMARQHRIPVLNVLLPGEEENGIVPETTE
jgi:hypothetical protein